MDTRFSDLFTHPENSIFQVVFYPDRVYHAQYLNATRSSRYRYNVQEVRTKVDTTLLKGEVYMDGLPYSNFLRIEYRPERLVELAREKGRFLRGEVLAFVRLLPEDPAAEAAGLVKLRYCRWIDAYQTELWQRLDAPGPSAHDFRVLDLMGADGDITHVGTFDAALENIKALRRVAIAFRENDRDLPFGYRIDPPEWDNNYQRTYEAPNSSQPNAPENTVRELSYLIDFQRGWYLEAADVEPVRYENPLMEETNPERAAGNVIEMRWLLQRELGGRLVFFHEVTIPPGKVEGTHRHVGTEELYYVVQGTGIAYLGENDDPKLAHLPVVERDIFGLGVRKCREVRVRPGSVIYTKSGGIHGIKSNARAPLKFVAFLYHSS